MSISKGSERVKAWIYVIINPWSEAMENENSLLGEGNTTFRWSSNKLEYLRPVVDHLAGRSARLILDDLIRGQPGLKEYVQVHDDLVRDLEKAAQRAHHELTADDAFTEAVTLLAKQEPSVVPKMDVSELAKWAAQRIINNGSDVSSRWEDYAFWTRHRVPLLTYRDRFPDVLAFAEQLRSKNDWLLARLGEVRNDLVEEHDVPPAFVP